MKYWIYKDARIAGPYERDAIAGLPGFDASTLVSAGDAPGGDEGQWAPAADVPDLAPMALAHGAAFAPDAPASSFGLLDKLQLESAGLIGDDQYPNAAEVLFQDAEIKRNFAELLAARTRGDDAEVRRLRGLVSELSVQLELMYRRVAQLENTHADFLRKLSADAAARVEAGARPQASSDPAAPMPASVASAAPMSTPVASAAPIAAPAVPIPPAPAVAAPAPVMPPLAFVEPVAAVPVAIPEAPPAPQTVVAQPEPPLTLPPAGSAPASEDAIARPAVVLPLEIPDLPEALAAPLPEAPSVPEIPALPSTAAPVPPLPFPAFEAPAETSGPVTASSTTDIAPLPPLPPLNSEADAAPALVPEPTPPVAAEPVRPASIAAPTPVPSPAPTRRLHFDKPKTLRIVPTTKVLRVVANEAAGASAPAPRESEAAREEMSVPPPPAVAVEIPAPSEEALPPMPQLSAPVAPPPAAEIPLPIPAMTAAAPSPVPSPIEAVPFVVPAPAVAAPSPAPAPVAAAVPAPAPSFSSPPQEFPSTSSIPAALPPSGMFASSQTPPSTAVFVPGAQAADSPPATQEVLARLAKPASAPAPAPKPRSGGKTFMILGGVLVAALVALGVAFLRHSRDLKQMAALDDGKPPVGAESAEDASARAAAPASGPAATPAPTAPLPAAATMPQAAPATAAAPAPAISTASTSAPASATSTVAAPAPQAPGPGDAAVELVKNFPLDGGRGTVEKWLQFSYSATPDAGQETWNATEQSDGTYLVEYRFVPNVQGAPQISYLFVADPARGYVLGKNRDAHDMLAGGGPVASGVETPKRARRRKAKKPARRPRARPRGAAPAESTPEDMPQLPLPPTQDAAPPSEGDGDFGSDTIQPRS